MIYGMVQFHLRDFEDFISRTQEMVDRGREYGMVSTTVYRNLEDPNFVTLFVEWETDEHIAQFMQDTQGEVQNMMTAAPIGFNIREKYEFYA